MRSTAKLVGGTVAIVAIVYVPLAWMYGWYPFQRQGGDKVIIVRDGSVLVEPSHGNDKKPKSKETDDEGRSGYKWMEKTSRIEIYDGPCSGTPLRNVDPSTSDLTIVVRRAASNDDLALEVVKDSTKNKPVFVRFPDELRLQWDSNAAHVVIDQNALSTYRITAVRVGGSAVWSSETSTNKPCVAFKK